MAEQKNPRVEKAKEMGIYVPEHVRLGVYSNFANISTTEHEVTITFFQQDTMGTTAVSKVVLPIKHAESIAKVLANALKDREQKLNK